MDLMAFQRLSMDALHNDERSDQQVPTNFVLLEEFHPPQA